MHEHDMDLIMDLAEGSLSESEAAAARDRLASCTECLQDLALQEAALESLAAAPRVYLTASESAALRSGVRERLGLEEAATAPGKPRRFPLGALAGAAAVLLAVVIAGPALNLLGSSTDDDSPAGVALSPAAPEIDDARSEAAPADPAAPDTATATAGDAGFSSALPPAAAPAPAEQALPRLSSSLDLAELKAAIVTDGIDLAPARFYDEAQALQAPAAAPEDASPVAGSDGEAPVESTDAPPPCDPESLGGAPGSTAIILGLVEIDAGGEALVIAFVTEPIEDTMLVIVDAATCEVLASH